MKDRDYKLTKDGRVCYIDDKGWSVGVRWTTLGVDENVTEQRPTDGQIYDFEGWERDLAEIVRLLDKHYYFPFSCGTERMDWMCNNCDRCARSNDSVPENDCWLSQAIYEHVGFGDGYLPIETAKRIFGDELDKPICPERQLGDDN